MEIIPVLAAVVIVKLLAVALVLAVVVILRLPEIIYALEEVLTNNRKSFKDKELRNEYVYNEIREKVSKGWEGANSELIPGVKNIDLISSDEHLMSLIRDGLKFRDKPTAKQAGASLAVLQQRKGTTVQGKDPNEDINKLREQARGGNKKAADNLLVAQLNRLRSTRRG